MCEAVMAGNQHSHRQTVSSTPRTCSRTGRPCGIQRRVVCLADFSYVTVLCVCVVCTDIFPSYSFLSPPPPPFPLPPFFFFFSLRRLGGINIVLGSTVRSTKAFLSVSVLHCIGFSSLKECLCWLTCHLCSVASWCWRPAGGLTIFAWSVEKKNS